MEKKELNRKILFLSWAIPPAQGGSSYISYELAKNFSSDELVLVGGKKYFQKAANLFVGNNKPRVYYLNSEINFKGHGDRFFWLFRLLLFPFLVFKLMYITKKEKITDFLVIFPDEFYLNLGQLTALIMRKRLHLYFHNTYIENRVGIWKFFAKFFQGIAFKKCLNLFTMSEGMTKLYHRNYPNISHKISTLPHTFEEYLSYSDSPPSNVFKFVLIGTFNHSNIEATNRIFQVLSEIKNIEVHVYTPVHKKILKYKWNLDLDSLGFNYHNAVSQNDVHGVLQQYDACILTHGFTGGYSLEEYQTIFPTRTIPLMISGRPILAHSPENSFLSEFLEKNKVALLLTTTDRAILKSSIIEFLNSEELRTQLVKNSLIVSDYFYGRNVAANLKKVLHES